MSSWFKCEVCQFGSSQLNDFYKHAMEHLVDPDAEIGASLRNIQQMSQVTGKDMADILKEPSILKNEDESSVKRPENQGFGQNIETSPDGPSSVQSNSFLISQLLSPVQCSTLGTFETSTESIIPCLVSHPAGLYPSLMAGLDNYNQTPIFLFPNKTFPSRSRRSKKEETWSSLHQKKSGDVFDLLNQISSNVNQTDPKSCPPNMLDELILASFMIGPMPDWHWFFSMRYRYIYENVSHWCSSFPLDPKAFENARKKYELADNMKFKAPRKRIRRPVKKTETPAQTASAVRAVVADLITLTETLELPFSGSKQAVFQAHPSRVRTESPLEKISSMLEKDNKLWKSPPFAGFSEDPKTFIWPMPCPVCSAVLVGVESYNSHLDRHVLEKFMNV